MKRTWDLPNNHEGNKRKKYGWRIGGRPVAAAQDLVDCRRWQKGGAMGRPTIWGGEGVCSLLGKVGLHKAWKEKQKGFLISTQIKIHLA